MNTPNYIYSQSTCIKKRLKKFTNEMRARFRDVSIQIKGKNWRSAMIKQVRMSRVFRSFLGRRRDQQFFVTVGHSYSDIFRSVHVAIFINLGEFQNGIPMSGIPKLTGLFCLHSSQQFLCNIHMQDSTFSEVRATKKAGLEIRPPGCFYHVEKR